jgi:GNAT superfamily N-acetyltransferase
MQHDLPVNNAGKSEFSIQVAEVLPGTTRFEGVLELAARVLAQDRHLAAPLPDAEESHVLAAFQGARCAGFLRYLIQVIGAEEGRPAVTYNGAALREGYVEAFGVDLRLRRRGVGTALQEHAMRQCRMAGCFQMRSRSPVSSTENYALKLAAGYVLHPSRENDSYYFLIKCAVACRNSSTGHVEVARMHRGSLEPMKSEDDCADTRGKPVSTQGHPPAGP